MFLCVAFNGELLPFMMDMATEEECIKAIEKLKEDYNFSKADYVVESDRIILHAWKKKVMKKRLYILKDTVILQTDTCYPDEVQPTKELLAFERNVSVEEIHVVEI